MKTLGVLVAIAAGLLATLTMLAMLVAGMPNSSPAQMAEIRAYMWITAAVGLAGFAAGVWGAAKGRRRFAAWAGATPLVFVVVLFAALLMLER